MDILDPGGTVHKNSQKCGQDRRKNYINSSDIPLFK